MPPPSDPAPTPRSVTKPAVAVLLAVLLGTARLVTLPRVTVEGPSMLPTLLPGDRLLVLPGPVRPGRLVVVSHPRDPGLLLVKRADAVDGRTVTVRGDNRSASTDSRHFGPVPRRLVLGRPVYRYTPADRSGWLWST